MIKRSKNKLKKAAALAGLLILQGSFTSCHTHHHDSPPSQEAPDLLSVTLNLSDFDDCSAKLNNGIYEGDHLRIRVLQMQSADFNQDGLVDGATVITVNSGGSGNFRILCLFMHDGTTLLHTDDVNIGDRVKVTNLTIDGEVITVDYLDRTADDSFATSPYIKKTIQYIVEGARLEKHTAD